MSVKSQFIQNRQGKDFVLYAGLLDAAHEAGLAGIATRLLQTPGADNEQTAICHATVTMRDTEGRERTFDGIGDANPANVNRMIAAHLIRMAETRAKARALRDAINVGMASIEELGGDDQDALQTRPDAPGRAATTPRAGSAGPGREAPAPRRSAAPTDRPAAVPSAAGPPSPGMATAEELEELSAADFGWTEFWSWARQRGYSDRAGLDQAVGKSTKGMAPVEIRAALRKLAVPA